MKKFLVIAAAWLTLASPTFAANVNIDGLPAASSVTGTDLLECEQAGTNRKCTAAQAAAYTYGLMGGDATAGATGAVTFATVNANVGSFGSTSQCVSLTVNAKGLVTAASAATCAPAIGSVTGLGTGVATFLATPSSANLLAALTTKTGTGNAVFGTAPTIDSLNATTAMTLAFLTGGGTQCLQVSNTGAVSATGSACGSGGGTGANPTATAGPTAVNGVATTFLRSDGAPAVQLGTAAQKGIVQVDGTTILASSGVISAATPIVVAETYIGTNYPFVTGDQAKLKFLSNASNQVPTIPQAGTTGFAANWFVQACNIGAGTQTITPTTSTIGGASTYVLPAASAADPACVAIVSDGTNYLIVPDFTKDVSRFTAGVLAQARGGAGTINGALKGNGSGVVSQAACADLSNAGTACPVNTGTSGATLPLLNGTNIWSGTQTFGSVVGTVTTQSGTTYTFASTDCGTTVRFSNASAVTATIPQGLPVGCAIAAVQAAAGQVSVNGSAVTPATLQSAHSYTKTFGAGAVIGLFNDATNHVILTGDGA